MTNLQEKFLQHQDNERNLAIYLKDFAERQKKYMMDAGQIAEGENGLSILKQFDYNNFAESEIEEYFDALDKNDKLEQLDALADIVVCYTGAFIISNIINNSNFVEPNDGRRTIHHLINHACNLMTPLINPNYNALDVVNEVIDNNFARAKKGEDGKFITQPDILEDGSKNPDAGKVIKEKDIKPNLKQFLRV